MTNRFGPTYICNDCGFQCSSVYKSRGCHGCGSINIKEVRMVLGASGPPKCTQCGEEIILKVPPVQICIHDDKYGYKFLPFCRFYHMMEWTEENCQCVRCKRVIDGNDMHDDDICKDCAEGKPIEAKVQEKPVPVVAQVVTPHGACAACGYVFTEPTSLCPDCDTPVGGASLGGA